VAIRKKAFHGHPNLHAHHHPIVIVANIIIIISISISIIIIIMTSVVRDKTSGCGDGVPDFETTPIRSIDGTLGFLPFSAQTDRTDPYQNVAVDFLSY
jgi:hypothetical protein